jgi:hypothetical protein
MLIGAFAVLALGGYLASRLFRKDGDATVFLPGPTTHGHYQIEMKCAACHEPWGGVREQSCIDCHGGALQAADDSHPKSKFTDPRNADRLTDIAADKCITCHIEHRPEITLAMGVTQPQDYCQHCHQDVAKERPSHEGMSFTTCSTVGCHNYHDNTALYEDFLIKHAADPAQLLVALLPELASKAPAVVASVKKPLQHDGHLGEAQDAGKIVADWTASAHAAAAVNCTACHGKAADWQAHPAQDSCAECHKDETAGFREGLHGMRLAQNLPAMQPALARLPMRPEAAHRTLTCTSCHGPHDADTRRAAVESCLQCHNDSHSLAYKDSRHHQLWLAELAGTAPAGSGVSCASCHMPREEHVQDGVTTVSVQHNQSLTLRPVEKMTRTVCIRCHGLGFTLDSLADPKLGRNNFDGIPGHHVESIDMALRRRTPAKAR